MNPQFSGPPAATYPGFPQPGHAPPGHPPVPQPVPGRPVLATFLDRLWASLIDGAFLFLLSLIYTIPLMVYIVTQAAAMVDPDAGTVEGERVTGYLLAVFISLGVSLVLGATVGYLYHVELALRTGQTPGKRLLKIFIVPVGGLPGHELSRGTLAKRWGSTFGLNLVPFGGYLDGLWQLWDKPYQQCLHDKAAGTVVVKVHAVSSTSIGTGQ